MNRFFPSVFVHALVTAFVALHLLVAFGVETLHSFYHGDVHSEHDYSGKQGSTTSESKKKTTDQERFASRPPRNITPYRPALLNTEASADLSNHIVCLFSVELRI